MDVDVDTDVEIAALEKQIESTPPDYSLHLKLIEICRSSGELEKLQKCRQNMRNSFPLTPNLWLDWIKDEISTLQNDDSDQQNHDVIKSLFDLAVEDYTSFEVWLEYVQWACGTGNTSLTRDTFEKAITAVGLHVSKGCLIWDAYREFESALLSLLISKDETESESSASLDESIMKHKAMVLAIFRRQLSLPLVGLEDAYEDYKEFLNGQEIDKRIESQYKTALKICECLQQYEDQLVDTDEDKTANLEVYNKYVDFELSCSNPPTPPSRIKCLFERAITDHCLNVELWLKYLTWLDRKLKAKEEILPAYQRAVRNVPWSTLIWNNYLLAAERLNSDPHFLKQLFNRALSEGGYSNAKECCSLWLTHIYQLKRGIDTQSDNKDYKILHGIFEKGAAFLKEKFSELGWDSDCTFRQCWARIEGGLINDITTFRKIFDDIMTEAGNGKKAHMWLLYLNAEREFNNYCNKDSSQKDWQHARRIWFKAVNSSSDYPETVFVQFLQFEMECGSIADYDAALQRVEQQRLRIRDRNKSQNVGQQKGKHDLADNKKAPPREPHSSKGKDFKRKTNDEDSSSSSKRQKPESSTTVSATVPSEFVVPIFLTATKPVEPMFQNPTRQQPSSTAGIDKSKYDRTVFVSNLDFKVGEETIRSIFQEKIGHVTDIRLVMLKPGRSKGFGYVEFENANFAIEALNLDRHKIDDRPMYVSKCIDKSAPHSGGQNQGPTSDDTPAGFTFKTGLEKNKLFVKNIHGRATEEDLREFFKPYGKLKSVRLVVQKSGQSKGLAYIEYEEDKEASKALTATDQSVLMGRTLTVALSNPPPRRTDNAPLMMSTDFNLLSTSASVTMRPRAIVASRPGVVNQGGGRRRENSQANLQPNGVNGVKAEPGKSNDEFRKMFMK